MAPEIICGQPHGITSDYYSLGVICYQCMLGRLPYGGDTRKEVWQNILDYQQQIKKDEIPEEWSLEAADFVNRLLQRKPNNRLGVNGPLEVKNHVWLKTFPWEKLKKGEFMPPFEPPKTSKEEESSSDDENSSEDLVNAQKSNLRRNSIQNLFTHFSQQNSHFSASSIHRPSEPPRAAQNLENTLKQPDLEEEGRRSHPTHDSEAMAAGASASFMMRNLVRNKESLHHTPPDLSTAGLFFSD